MLGREELQRDSAALRKGNRNETMLNGMKNEERRQRKELV